MLMKTYFVVFYGTIPYCFGIDFYNLIIIDGFYFYMYVYFVDIYLFVGALIV